MLKNDINRRFLIQILMFERKTWYENKSRVDKRNVERCGKIPRGPKKLIPTCVDKYCSFYLISPDSYNEMM